MIPYLPVFGLCGAWVTAAGDDMASEMFFVDHVRILPPEPPLRKPRPLEVFGLLHKIPFFSGIESHTPMHASYQVGRSVNVGGLTQSTRASSVRPLGRAQQRGVHPRVHTYATAAPQTDGT